jgi:hypothetical protein
MDDPYQDDSGRWEEPRNDLGVVHYHEQAAPFAISDWELGVHIPSLIVERLMVTQQFELALKVMGPLFHPSIDGEALSRMLVLPTVSWRQRPEARLQPGLGAVCQ